MQMYKFEFSWYQTINWSIASMKDNSMRQFFPYCIYILRNYKSKIKSEFLNICIIIELFHIRPVYFNYCTITCKCFKFLVLKFCCDHSKCQMDSGRLFLIDCIFIQMVTIVPVELPAISIDGPSYLIKW